MHHTCKTTKDASAHRTTKTQTVTPPTSLTTACSTITATTVTTNLQSFALPVCKNDNKPNLTDSVECQTFRDFLKCLNFSFRRMPMRHRSSTPNNLLQSCPIFDALGHKTWPSPVEAQRKPWEQAETLKQTANFALLFGLKI